jgi:hypothetical protein
MCARELKIAAAGARGRSLYSWLAGSDLTMKK